MTFEANERLVAPIHQGEEDAVRFHFDHRKKCGWIKPGFSGGGHDMIFDTRCEHWTSFRGNLAPEGGGGDAFSLRLPPLNFPHGSKIRKCH